MLYETYSAIRESSSLIAKYETRDCSVVAVAAAAGVSYDVAHATLKKLGRKDRQGARSIQISAAMSNLGFKLAAHKTCCKTVKKLPAYMPANRTFIVYVRGHVLTVVNRKVLDWTADRQHRVTHVFEVLPVAAPVQPVAPVVPVVAPKPAPAKPKQTQGACAAIWAHCSANFHSPLKAHRAALIAMGYNKNTVNRQVGEWAKANNVI